MSIELEIRNGEEAWPAVKPLFDIVWGGAVDNSAWKHTRWASADLRILLETPENGLICHVGLYFRNVIWNGRRMHIGGIGGVSTHPAVRKQGYASVALNAAVQTLRDRQDAQFGLLFCEPHNAAFYLTRGWHAFTGEIYVEQPGGRVLFEAMAPFVFDIKRAPRQGTIDLCGPPW